MSHTPEGSIGTFVTVGSTDKYQFDRLIRAVIAMAPVLPQPIVIQHGACTVPIPITIRHEPFIARDSILQYLKAARLIICHAGVGTIVDCLQASAVFVAVARRERFNEVSDDHQIDLVHGLSKAGLQDCFAEIDELRSVVEKTLDQQTRNRNPLNTSELVAEVRGAIEAVPTKINPLKLALAASSGGHYSELELLSPVFQGYSHFYVANRIVGGPPSSEKIFYLGATDHDWRALLRIKDAWKVLSVERPAVVLSTGSSSTLVLMFLGRFFFGCHVIYIESLTRVNKPSFTGKLAYWIANRFIYRWPALSENFSRGTYIPAVGLNTVSSSNWSTHDAS